ncbi:MAG: hypothetical protein U1E37_02770 [Sphingomonadaceae bacterium]
MDEELKARLENIRKRTLWQMERQREKERAEMAAAIRERASQATAGSGDNPDPVVIIGANGEPITLPPGWDEECYYLNICGNVPESYKRRRDENS